MLNIKALRDQRAEKAKEARNLLDTNTGDKWSKDVEKQVDAIYEEIDRIDAQIARRCGRFPHKWRRPVSRLSLIHI